MRLHRRHVDRLGGHVPKRYLKRGGWFRPVTRGSVYWIPCGRKNFSPSREPKRIGNLALWRALKRNQQKRMQSIVEDVIAKEVLDV